MKDVMLSFGKGLDGYLTKDQIKNSSPLVFANAPTNPDVSKKYLSPPYRHTKLFNFMRIFYKIS